MDSEQRKGQQTAPATVASTANLDANIARMFPQLNLKKMKSVLNSMNSENILAARVPVGCPAACKLRNNAFITWKAKSTQDKLNIISLSWAYSIFI